MNVGANWKYLQVEEGRLGPGFDVAESDVGDFSIVSNSAGGPVAKQYSKQLQLILEGLSLAEMKIVRAEVDSGETRGLSIDERVLRVDYPIVMAGVTDFVALRRRLSAAQIRVGQRPGDKGGNGNKRIRLHLESNGVSPEDFVAQIISPGGVLRLQHTATSADVIAQIRTLSKDEIQSAIDQWTSIGREEFLRVHRAHSAFKYRILVGDSELDAKAIVVGALRLARPQLGEFKASVFNGNSQTVAKPLRQLGFDVIDMDVDESEVEDDKHQQEIMNRLLIGPLERRQLVKSRRGQGVFRDNVELREPRCRVTGVANPKYLVASHIKPWRKSNNVEKLDGDNGLLLAPHVDFLFDRGFISFEDDGSVIVSPVIEDGALEAWGISGVRNVGAFSTAQSVYLRYHREFILKK